jgi:hypothetical protein
MRIVPVWFGGRWIWTTASKETCHDLKLKMIPSM